MDYIIECPKHNGRFNYRTGAAKGAPVCVNLYTSTPTRSRSRATTSSLRSDAMAGMVIIGGVALSNGTTIPADLVVIGVGAVPNTGLAAEAGLAIENGIAVDETLATSDPAIFAAGDCCSFPHPLYEHRRVRLESWRSAQELGTLATRNILGQAEPISAVPWFWSTSTTSRCRSPASPKAPRPRCDASSGTAPSYSSTSRPTAGCWPPPASASATRLPRTSASPR